MVRRWLTTSADASATDSSSVPSTPGAGWWAIAPTTRSPYRIGKCAPSADATGEPAESTKPAAPSAVYTTRLPGMPIARSTAASSSARRRLVTAHTFEELAQFARPTEGTGQHADQEDHRQQGDQTTLQLRDLLQDHRVADGPRTQHPDHDRQRQTHQAGEPVADDRSDPGVPVPPVRDPARPHDAHREQEAEQADRTLQRPQHGQHRGQRPVLRQPDRLDSDSNAAGSSSSVDVTYASATVTLARGFGSRPVGNARITHDDRQRQRLGQVADRRQVQHRHGLHANTRRTSPVSTSSEPNGFVRLTPAR